MKRIHNYILLSVLAFVAVGCIEEEFINDIPSSESGNEVKFGLSLGSPQTKTVYGAVDTTYKDNKIDKVFYPIYWVEGDKVQIFSPQCPLDRRNAEYKVELPLDANGNLLPQPNYAKDLTPTGEYGVQWGNTAKANFYSVYPSSGASWSYESNVTTAKLNIASSQEANLTLDNGVYGAADMSNVIMYAEKLDVPNGDEVLLNYKPYSTILEIDLGIAQIKDDQGNNTGKYGTVKIESITLTAPQKTNITGDFTLAFNGGTPTIAAAGNNGNVITMTFKAQPMLSESNQTLKAQMALIPLSGITSLKDWEISVKVYEGTATSDTTYTKTLTATSELTAGKIHKIKLPRFTSTTAWEPDLDKWITQLKDYKNIYLTELSVPGAWYAGGKIYTASGEVSKNYQSTNDISVLWNAGVRGFAVECRSSSTLQWGGYKPSSVVVSGTQSNGALGSYVTGGTKIRTVIKSVADAVANTVTTTNGIKDGEYAILVLSYADGGNDGHRDEDHAYFINGIKTEIKESGATNIYSSAITPSTTISDVIGQLIIMVNVDYELTKDSYDGSMNALLTYVPHVDHLVKHMAEGETSVDYSKIRFSPMYWQTWVDSYKTSPLITPTSTENMYLCFASANRTQLNTGTDKSIPTYAQRQSALRSMIVSSHEISENSAHNVLFFFNAGGTQTTSQTDGTTDATAFASTMNPWLLEVIKLKANGGTDTNGYYSGTAGTRVEADASSLGLVFFNQCTNATYNGPEIIKEIIMMNDKVKLQRAPAATQRSYLATATVGGDAF